MDPKILKPIIVLAIWVGIWFLIVPLARRKGVSGFKWYFAALGAFYAPFILIAFGPIFLSILVDKPENRAMLRIVMDNLPSLALMGLGAGGTCLFLVRRKLRQQRDVGTILPEDHP